MSTDVNASTPDTGSGEKAKDPLAVAEQRRKDAQAALTPLQQENARLKAELQEQKHSVNTSVITPEKQTELDDLKFTDPDKWRTEMNTIEQENQKASQSRIDEETKKQTDIATTQQFLRQNPNLDAKLVQQVIPSAMKGKYEAGELSMQDLLDAGKKLLNGATVASVMAPNTPNIGDVAGSDKPTDQAKQKQVEKDWTKTLV